MEKDLISLNNSEKSITILWNLLILIYSTSNLKENYDNIS